MNTIILPGFSKRNQEWAVEAQAELQSADIDSQVHEWAHWETGRDGDFAAENEVEKILEAVGEEEANLLAKSVGTLVAMLIVAHARDQLNKIILCGIPYKWDGLKDKERHEYQHLSDLDTSQIQVFQNEHDPLSTYDEVEELVHSVNPDIEVTSKPRDDHHYPYYEDFIRFLSEGS